MLVLITDDMVFLLRYEADRCAFQCHNFGPSPDKGLGIQTAVTFLSDDTDKNLGLFQKIFLSASSDPKQAAFSILASTYSFDLNQENFNQKLSLVTLFPYLFPFGNLFCVQHLL
jgi:hypothetical protein